MSLLLTLGSDRRDLVGAFLVESLVLGVAGSLAGIVFGYLMARFSIDKVSSTISELYFYVNVESIRLTTPVILIGLGVGFSATLIGTALPALEAAFTPPILGMKRRSIEDRAHGIKGLLFVSGLICFVAALAYRVGLTVFHILGICFGIRDDAGFCIFHTINSVSVHALFRHWVEAGNRLVGRIPCRQNNSSITEPNQYSGGRARGSAFHDHRRGYYDTQFPRIGRGLARRISAGRSVHISCNHQVGPPTSAGPDRDIGEGQPRVDAVERYSAYDIYLANKPVRLRVVDGSVLQRHSRFHFIAGGKSAWDNLKKGGVFISESLGYRFGLGVGDKVVLATPEGKRSFPVVSIVRDYSSDQGAIQIDRELYERLWKDDRVQSVALFLRPGASAEEVRKSIVDQFPSLDRTIVSNAQMKDDALRIFDKTFAPTSTLKGVSLLVALLGIATALTAILMERLPRDEGARIFRAHTSRVGQNKHLSGYDNGTAVFHHFSGVRCHPHLYHYLCNQFSLFWMVHRYIR